MLWRWLRGAGARAPEVARVRARITDALWRSILLRYPFLDLPAPAEAERLRNRAAWMLASKTWHGAGGLELTDTIRLAIAAQAALPILNLPVALFEGWTEVIVYPAAFRVALQHEDDAGVVHESVEELSGEAWPGGPVILAWDSDVADHTLPHGSNIVIHEFAHKLDWYGASAANGVPALFQHTDLSPLRWQQVLADSFDAFSLALDRAEAAIPAHIDPNSPDAERWYASLPLNPYAATDEAEFFAVSSEVFFTAPGPLAQAFPEWYALLVAYYRQNPLERLSATAQSC